MAHMDDLYGTDPVADPQTTKAAPRMTTPCAAGCGHNVDTSRQHIVSHPFGMMKPERVFCSERCADDYLIARERERQRIAS